MTFGKPIKRNAGITAQRRASKRRRLTRDERANKAEVRVRDGKISNTPTTGRCRFPLCGCHALTVCEGSPAFVEVSHQRHKGMGGDPTGERSRPELLICVCAWRHKEGHVALDKKNLRWVPLTAAGANGPVKWEIDRSYVSGRGSNEWVELARESAVQVLEALTEFGETVLRQLAQMRS